MFHRPIHAESSKVYTINLYHFSTVITVLKTYILRQIKSDIETVYTCMYSSDEEFLFTYGSEVVIGTILG